MAVRKSKSSGNASVSVRGYEMNPAWYSSSAIFMMASGDARIARFRRFCISSVFSGTGGLRVVGRPDSESTVAVRAARALSKSASAKPRSNTRSRAQWNSANDDDAAASRRSPGFRGFRGAFPAFGACFTMIFQNFSGTCASMSHLRCTMNPSVGNWHGP